MAKCFCGCGTKVGFAMRPVNTRGKHIVKDLTKVQQLLDGVRYSPTLEEYIDDGRTLAVAVAACVHDGGPPSDELERATAGWRAAGRYYTTGGLGRVVRQQGIGNDEAAALLAS